MPNGKDKDVVATGDNFYYSIAEYQNYGEPYDGTNIMNPVTVESQAITSDGTMYVMSGGQFHLVANTKLVTMPVHRAYLSLPEEAKAKQVVFDFSDDLDEENLPTAIDDVTDRADNDNAIYTLHGAKVVTPAKGLYIKNGKKIVIR